MTTSNIFVKDPLAVLDYAFDWSDWLQSLETISTHVITIPTGLVESTPHTEAAGVVTIWLSGGTAGTKYTVSCLITTNGGRTDERSITIVCENR